MIDDIRSDDDLTPPDDVTATAGEWLSIGDAAQRLHFTTRTIHRKINSGELPKRTLRGGRTRVWVSQGLIQRGEEDAEIEGVSETQNDTSGQDLAVLDRHLALIERVNQLVAEQVTPLLTVIDARDTTIREQAEEIGRLKAELEAEIERQTVTSADVPDTRPWWRFWR